MKNARNKNRWARIFLSGAFGLMLVFNVMVSIEFKNDKLFPSLTFVELGNKVFAQGGEDCPKFEEPGGATVYVCDGYTIVYSAVVDFGACAGQFTNCYDFYPN
jgi:hypothetical protein